MDTQRLRSSWQQVAQHGDQVPLFFYSTLFLAHPQTRELFPVSMAGQRDRLVTALGRIVSDVDRVDVLVPFLQQLGRDHRKFSALPEHYPAVGSALLATLAHFLGPAWTAELQALWQDAYAVVARAMIEAADEAARVSPPWWEAVIVEHERRGPDIAVIRARPSDQLDYLPGQSVAVEVALRPRLWRYYSPANRPRADGTLELHVRLIGGPVSSALVLATQPGDVLRLGAPVGTRLTLDPHPAQDLLLLAGGTGLAPLKALVEQVVEEHRAGQVRRRVHLFVGVRTARELYDLPALERLDREWPWLTVIPAVSADPTYLGERGDVVDVALRHGQWREHQVYACGSEAMVTGTVERLLGAGISFDRIGYEEFVSDPYAAEPLDPRVLSTREGGLS